MMNENTKDRLVKIVIPVYRENLTPDEEISFNQCYAVLSRYPLVIIKPNSLEVNALCRQYPLLQTESFDDKYFRSIESYNELMLSSEFYARFPDSTYILICQLDAFVFRDELQAWCNKSYDYIGAPWIAIPGNSWIIRTNRFIGKMFGKTYPREAIFYKVGNGGFSLRKTSRFYEIASNYQSLIKSYLDAETKEIYAAEDVFWSLKVPELEADFNIPDYREAVSFAMDRKPAIAMKINGGNLPFACHGFNKPKVRKFWKPIIEKSIVPQLDLHKYGK
jgi:hypothetical protein